MAVRDPAKKVDEASGFDPEVRGLVKHLSASADPSRLKIMFILLDGSRHVGALVDALESMSQPAVSHHLALMRLSGVVDCDRDGQRNFYSLTERGRALAGALRPLVEAS